jgi:putative transposase
MIILFIHLLTTGAKLLDPGGAKAIIAENLLLKQQLLVVTRSRRRAPNLSTADRFLMGFWSLFLRPGRIAKIALSIRPSTLLNFHQCLVRRKYRRLFSPKKRTKPGPKGPSEPLIQAIVELKRRNRSFGCPRIALIISKTFSIEIDKHVVRRVLVKHYHPESGGGGRSWLTFLGDMKDSLWSVDLFRCESIRLKSHWVLVVMDQFTRRLIGFGVHAGEVDGIALCRMFNRIVSGKKLPRYLSSDHDPLFEYHRWQANLRILEIEPVKTVPYTPVSHPFVERLIGTIRRGFLTRRYSGTRLICSGSLKHSRIITIAAVFTARLWVIRPSNSAVNP